MEKRRKEKVKFISIKTKLLGIILPVIIMIIAVLVGLSYNVSKRAIESNAKELLQTSAEGQSARIEAWLEQNLAAFNAVKHDIEQCRLEGKELQGFLNSYLGFDNNYPDGLQVAEQDGTLYKPKSVEEGQEGGKELLPVKDLGITETEWFRAGMTRVNLGFTDAYANENGQQVISACGMLKSYTGHVRVISADLSLDKVSVYVNSYVKMKDAHAFLVNAKDNTVLASHDTASISKKLTDLDSKYMEKIADRILGEQLDLSEIEGNMSVFQKIKGTAWVLVSYVPSKTVYQDLDFIRKVMLLFGVIFILILTVLVERTVHIVISPVKILTNAVQKMTDGDFTTQLHVKGNDEIGVMGKCVEKFIHTMCGMIRSINGVSCTLHNQADNSNDISDMMFDAAKIQNESMKELNATVEQLSISVGELADNATTLAVVVAETKEDGGDVSSKMKETVDISQIGKNDMHDISSAMQNINDSVGKLQLAIDEVGSASEEISNITKVIGDIADETNLLSLNASIEAARAGEAGKGFTVVASEIGKLAQTSMVSVQDIDNLVLKIKTSVRDVVSQAGESVNNISNSNLLIEKALGTFDVIFENIVTVGGLVQKMIQKIEEVDSVAGSVAAISEEQAASSEEILSSSDVLLEQTNGLMENSENVAKESKELTTSAEELATQISSFKIDK